MLTIDQLRNSVDCFTGQPAFAVPVVDLPGRNNLNLSIAIGYGGPTWPQAATWNLDAPTGVLGLGWSLPLQGVFAVAGQSSAPAAMSYLLAWRGGPRRLFCTGQANNGDWTYGTDSGDFWKIWYRPATETWTVIDENGITHVFGDALSGRSTVIWNVAWDNWTGTSNRVVGQNSFATGWLLNNSHDWLGDEVSYRYTTTPVAVGNGNGNGNGQAYTQAVVLQSAVAVDGSQAVFSYATKNANEYVIPHQNPSPPNAYQDPISTQYLDHIDILASNGTLLERVQFSYPATLLGASTYPKRVLAGIQSGKPGAMLPGVKFSYWGQDGGDNVSTTHLYNAGNNALYGAIKQITLPTGGTVAYAYTQTAPLQYAARKLTLAAPQTGAGSPLFYFEENYVVATWLGSDGNAYVQAYTWNGRWIAANFAALPVAGATGYAAMQVATAADGFAVWGAGQLHLYHVNATAIGQWVEPITGSNPVKSYYQPTFTGNESTQLVAGNGFAALLGLTSGTLYRYRWLGTAWANDDAITIGGGSAALTLGARSDMLAALAGATATTAATLYIYRRDLAGVWSAQQRAVNLGLMLPQQVVLVMGETFAAVMSRQTIAGGVQAGYAAVWWSADLSVVQSSVWPMQSLPAGATPPLPQVASSVIAVGETLYRFDGVQWNVYNLGAVTYAGYTTPTMSLGADVAIRRIANTANNAAAYDISAYNPNTGTWTTTQSSPTASALAIAAPNTAGATANYGIVASTLSYLQPSGTWTPTSVVLPATLSLADCGTVQVLGSNYLIYQSGTGTSGIATNVAFLGNGTAAAASSGALSQQSVAVTGKPMSALVGRAAFVTYTGTFGAAGSQLTLYRAVNGDMSSVQTAYAIATVTSNNGFSSVPSVNATVVQGYTFNATAATINPGGTTPAFNMTTVIPGSPSGASPNGTLLLSMFNGLAASENPVVAYPTGSNTNAAQYPSTVVGAPYFQQAMPASSATSTSSARSYLWVTVSTLGATGGSAYVRQRQSDTMTDGVTRTSTATYDAATGLPVTQTVNNVTSTGQAEQITQTSTYFPAQYDPQNTLNLLTPVIEVVETVTVGSTTTTSSQTIQTWRNDWGSGSTQWAPDRVFRAAVASPTAFNSWQWTQPDPAAGSGWLKVQRVTARSTHGLVLQSTDVLARNTGIVYDTTGTEMVASAFGASVGKTTLSWYGCEPYEGTGPWTSSNPALTIASYLTQADHHTGTQCLALPATPQGSTAAGPKASFVPSDQTVRYLFTCWARPAAGYNVANGRAQWSIQPFDPVTGNNAGNAIVVTVTPDPPQNQTVVPWTYFSQLLDLPALKAASPSGTLGFTAVATNLNTGAVCYLDELRFQPLETTFAARVYDPTSWLITANIDAGGQAQQIVNDAYNRPIASVGPDQRVEYLVMPSLSRSLTPADTFSPDTPNSLLAVSTTQTSLYDDFRGDSLTNWTCTDAAHWAVANGVLGYTGTGSGTGIGPLGATAQFNKFAFTNFAARINIATTGAPTKSLAIGNGLLFMRWNPTLSQWELVELTGSGFNTVTLRKSSKAVQGFRDNMMFAIIDNFAVGYVDGVQLFSYQYQPPNTLPAGYGRVTLAAAQAANFDNLFLLDSPQLSLTFGDGLGTLLQQFDVQGFQPTALPPPPFAGKSIGTVSGCFYDSLGRVSTARQAAAASLDLQTVDSGGSMPTSLVNGNQDSYLYTAAGAQLTIPSYLAGTGGYTFATPSYEPSPLSRVTEIVAPRDSNAPAANFTTGFQYSSSPSLASTGPVVGQTSNFLVETTTWPFKTPSGGNLVTGSSIVMRDQLGREISRRLGNASDGYLRTDVVYDDTAKTVQVQNPNAFAPPGNSTPATWTETYTYNYLNLIASRVTANDGTTSYMYDDAGRLRFVQTAAGAALTPQQILYTKYDALNRVVETGAIQDAGYPFGAALQAKANVAAFPIVDPDKSSDPNYATGTWRKSFAYDTDGTQTRYLVGQLWQASINQNGNIAADTERYNYDAFANVVSKTVKMAALSTSVSYPVTFTYNGQNLLSRIDYPALDNHNPSVAFSFDRLGRIAGVGKPDPEQGVVDPDHPPLAPAIFYASYEYDPYSRLQVAQLRNDPEINKPIARGYTYTDSGWPTAVVGDYFSEIIAYTNGVDGTAYYTGQPANIATSYLPNANFTPAPTAYGVALNYDSYGRMLTAANSTDAGLSLAMAQNGFDANGNIGTLSLGLTSSTYNYRSNAGKTINDQVATVGSSVNNTANFVTAPVNASNVSGWTWGSNNHGPSGSGITTTDPTGGQSLLLAGGGIGHWEALQQATYLPPSGSYTLTSVVLTGSGFATAIDTAGWYAVLYAASGPVAVVPLGSIPVEVVFTTITTTIDIAALVASYGNGAAIVKVALQLRNGLRNADGSTGPAIYVRSVSLTGSSTTPVYGYDDIGNVNAAMSNNIYGITYDATTNRTTNMRLTSASGNQLQFSYGADDNRTLKTYQTGGGSPATLSQTMTITGLDGRPLVEKTTGSGAAVRYYIPGATGVVATVENGALKYLIQDRLGSTRAVVDSATSQAATVDYQPYGGPMRATGQPWADPLYTGQEIDTETRLYDFHARFYDPALRRFYGADPGGQYASPYLYAGNDPETLTDPSGRDAIIRVNSTSGTIEAWSKVVLYGPDANAGSVAAFQADIDAHWNKFKYTDPMSGKVYQVGFNTIVETGNAPPAAAYFRVGTGVNYMETNFTGGRSHVEGNLYKGLFVNSPVSDPGVGAHEFGHLLGLRDRYIEKGQSTMQWLVEKMFFRRGELKGYETNLMNHHWNGHVYQSDIDEIVGPAVAELYCSLQDIDGGAGFVACRSNVEYHLTPEYDWTNRERKLLVGYYAGLVGILYAPVVAYDYIVENGIPGAGLARGAWAAIRPAAQVASLWVWRHKKPAVFTLVAASAIYTVVQVADQFGFFRNTTKSG